MECRLSRSCRVTSFLSALVWVAVAGCGAKDTDSSPEVSSATVSAAQTAVNETEQAEEQSRSAADSAPPELTAPEVTAASTPEQEAPAAPASPRAPATVAEASALLDLRSLPRTKPVDEDSLGSFAELNYESKATIEEAYRFYRDKLVGEGWQELPGAYLSKEYASGSFSKEGFRLSISVIPSGEPDVVTIHLSNHGNIALADLPAPEGSKTFFSGPSSVMYLSEAKPEEAAAQIREALLAKGWEPYGEAGDVDYYKQNAIRIQANVMVAPAQGNKTMITYGSDLLVFDIPVPPDSENVQYSDLPAQIFFDFPGTYEELQAYFVAELGKRGWKMTTEKPVKIDWKDFIIFRNDAKDMVDVQMTTFEGKTRVLAKFKTAREMEEEEKRFKELQRKKKEEMNKPLPKLSIPLPEGASDLEETPTSITMKVKIGTAQAKTEKLRDHLLKAGWKEENANLEKVFGDMSLSNGDQRISLTYTDPGIIPAEIRIRSYFVELVAESKD